MSFFTPRKIVAVLAIAASIFVFQNCGSGVHSNGVDSSSQSSNGGGDGSTPTPGPNTPHMLSPAISINEGTTGVANVTIMNAAANADFTLLWEVLSTGGTTATTAEFSTVTGFVQVPAGQSNTSINLTTLKDNLYGVPNKTYTLRIREAAARLATIDVAVTVVQDSFTASITVAQASSCAAINGVAKCWGDNNFGQLGNGSNVDSRIPVAVTGFPAGSSVKQISLGGQNGGGAYGCAVLQTGALYCWGLNTGGQLGNATNTNRNTAGLVSGMDSGVTAVSTGLNHACAIKAGALYCWGTNTQGQLGLGDNLIRFAPVAVPGFATGVTAVAAGGQFTCVLVNGGTKCFGLGTSGQLGNAANLSSLTPVEVSGGTTGVTQISAGNSHVCAMIAGAAKCWGSNASGQLGDNTGVAKNIATQVMGLVAGSGVTQILAGLNFTCALVNGVPYCWGVNAFNQTGDGGARIVPGVASPVLGAGFMGLAVGFEGQHACAVKPPLNIHCWGRGDSGQLGNNAAPNSAFPSATAITF